MAASSPPPGDPKPLSPPVPAKEDPGPAPAPPTCRLCAKESEGAVDIFSDSGRERGLPEKCRQCLPVLVRVPGRKKGTPCLFTVWSGGREQSGGSREREGERERGGTPDGREREMGKITDEVSQNEN